MRPALFIVSLAGSLALSGDLAGGDWENPPLYVVSQKVELIVGKELTVVSGRIAFKYVQADDTEHLPEIFFHYPLYVKNEISDWRTIEEVAGFELQIGGRPFKPTTGSVISAESLSDYPVPADAAVAFLTFAVPRKLAEQGFEATIHYVQPNFSYLGGRVALHTPWLPKSMRQHPYLSLADNVFELHLTAGKDLTMRRIPTNAEVLGESPTEIAAVPEHRRTIAVTLR